MMLPNKRNIHDRSWGIGYILAVPASLNSTSLYKSLLTFTLLFLFIKSYGQRDSTFIENCHSIGIVVENLQIKEGLNLGLVFSGPQYGIHYNFTKSYDMHKFTFDAQIGGAILESRKMEGFNINFKPVDFSYLYRVTLSNKSQIYLGGNLLLNYNYQLYPDLQSGQSYWLSQIQLNPVITYTLQLPKDKIEFQLMNSIFGFCSRPPVSRNPYFFEINFNEFAANAHSDFQVGSFNNFNNTDFRITYTLQRTKRDYILGYAFYYFEYYKAPVFEMISHSFLLQIQFKCK